MIIYKIQSSVVEMGNLSCYNLQPQPYTPTIYAQESQANEDIMDIINFTQHLDLQSENNFFIEYKGDKGIMQYIGISLQNLSQLYNFVKFIKDQQASEENNEVKPTDQNQPNRQSEMIIENIKNALFELNRTTKKHIKALNFSNRQNLSNQINIPYFLPWVTPKNSSVCVYIGEWRFENRHIFLNLPFGLGRLYFSNQTWEGSIQTSFKNLQEISPNQTNLNKLLQNSKVSIRQKLAVIKENLKIHLEGIGRKFTKDQQYSGNFQNGKLNGKGQYKNYKQEYSYEGTWVDGLKQGKGVEKTKLTYYEGSFSQNKKNGQGTLIFYISTQQQNERQNQQRNLQRMSQKSPEYLRAKQTVKVQMNLDEKSDNLIKKILRQTISNYQGQKLLTLDKYTNDSWQIQQFPFINKSFIENLKFQQSIRTNFVQKYSGHFRNNLFHGKGVYQWSKGNLYAGDWVDGKIQGEGKFFWKDGYSYYGEYKNDLKHGKGEMKWDPYKRHRGNWAFGKKHGYGEQIRIYLKNNDLCLIVKAGLWKNSKIKKSDVYWQRIIKISEEFPQNQLFLSNMQFYYSGLELNEEVKRRLLEQRTKQYFKNPCQICGSYFLRIKGQNQEQKFWNIIKQNLEIQNESQPLMCQECNKKNQAYEKLNSPKKGESNEVSINE